MPYSVTNIFSNLICLILLQKSFSNNVFRFNVGIYYCYNSGNTKDSAFSILFHVVNSLRISLVRMTLLLLIISIGSNVSINSLLGTKLLILFALIF